MCVIHVSLGSCEWGCLDSLGLELEVVTCHSLWVLRTKFRYPAAAMHGP